MATGLDRRVRKTRQALHLALLELMLEKGYESVTVQDVIERADVGRTTFYAHFTDKQGLLRHGIENLQDQVREAATARPAGTDSTGRFFAFSLPLLEHVHGHRHLTPLLTGRQGGALLRLWFDEMVADLAREDLARHLPAGHSTRIPLDTVVAFVAGGFASLLIWWVESGARYRPAEVDEMFHTATVPGLAAVLNL